MSNITSGVEKDFHNSQNAFTEAGHDERYKKVMAVILRHLSEKDWTGKVVFDIACGTGGYGRQFASLGADVFYFDGREENFSFFPEPAPLDRRITIDLEKDEFSSDLPKPDLILLMGILYHVGDPREVIKKVSNLGDNICIETSSLDHDGEAIVFFEEAVAPNHNSLTGRACRPSPGWLKKVLMQDGSYEWIKDISHKDANLAPSKGFSGEKYDWDFQRTCGWRRDDYSLRKLFLASKKNEFSPFVD
jgi:SAM-dependent methyltransferase